MTPPPGSAVQDSTAGLQATLLGVGTIGLPVIRTCVRYFDPEPA